MIYQRISRTASRQPQGTWAGTHCHRPHWWWGREKEVGERKRQMVEMEIEEEGCRGGCRGERERRRRRER
jgi:hypothetical protein